MLRQWLLPSLLLPLACSIPRGGSEAETATLVLRCHEGRVSAFMVVADTAGIAVGELPEDAVEVELDGSPECSESAP